MNAANRVILFLIGLLAAAAGTLGALTALDIATPPYIGDVRDEARATDWSDATVLWWVAGIAVVTAVVLLALLLAELRPPRLRARQLPIMPGDRGTTTISDGTLTSALTGSADRVDGVSSARVRFRDGASAPTGPVDVDVHTETGADVVRVGTDVQKAVLSRLTNIFGEEADRGRIDVRCRPVAPAKDTRQRSIE